MTKEDPPRPRDDRGWRWIPRGVYALVVGWVVYGVLLADHSDPDISIPLLWGCIGCGDGLLLFTHPARGVATRQFAGWLLVLGVSLIAIASVGFLAPPLPMGLAIFGSMGNLAVLVLLIKARESLHPVDPDVFS